MNHREQIHASKSLPWDAIVVGAGPAGCMAAALLAREGLRVVVLEKSAAPPVKVCGEYLSPGCLRLLKRIGALCSLYDAGARPLSGMRIHTAAGLSLEAAYPPGQTQRDLPIHGLAIRRDRLDPILLDCAIKSGIEFAPHFQVSDLLWQNGRVVGIRGGHRGESATLHGRLIIGADGRNSVVARRLGAVRRHPWLDKIALVGYAAGVIRAEGQGEIFLGRDRYCILNPIAPDLTNIGLVMNRREFHRPADPPDFLREIGGSFPHLTDRLARARMIAPVRCLGPLAHQATRLTVPGALLIGDAAGFLDPFTGEGIHAALRSAELAVDAIRGTLPFDPGPIPEQHEYALAWRREFHAKWRLCTLLQRAIRRPLLAEWLVSRLKERPSLTASIMAVVGDLMAAQDLGPLGVAARLLSGEEPPHSALVNLP